VGEKILYSLLAPTNSGMWQELFLSKQHGILLEQLHMNTQHERVMRYFSLAAVVQTLLVLRRTVFMTFRVHERARKRCESHEFQNTMLDA